MKYIKNFLCRNIKIFVGLFLYAVGIVFTIKADLGLSPWDILHDGIDKSTFLSFGFAGIFVGFLILIYLYIAGGKIGIGTILNMIFIGVFIDIILKIDFIPKATNIFIMIFMLILGMFIIAFATYFYISPKMGSGPRDGLMLHVFSNTKLPLFACKIIIEGIATLIGFLLGGHVGVGTVIAVLLSGPITQFVFKLLKFDANNILHENVAESIAKLYNKN